MMNSHRVISPIVKINFAGWASDTLALQNNGWGVHSLEDYESHSIKIMLVNERVGLKLVSNSMPIELQLDYRYPTTANVQQVISLHTKIILQNRSIFDFRQVDAVPQIVEMKEMSYYDINVFNKITERNNEIIIDPNEVGLWMKRIKDAQKPRQKEIREKLRRPPAPEHTVHAQIISLAA